MGFLKYSTKKKHKTFFSFSKTRPQADANKTSIAHSILAPVLHVLCKKPTIIMRKVHLEVPPTSCITSCLYIISKRMFCLKSIQCQRAGRRTVTCGLNRGGRGKSLKQHMSLIKPQEALYKESAKYILKITKKQLTTCSKKSTSRMKAAKLHRRFTEKNVLLPGWTKACILPIPSSSPSPVMLTARSSSKTDSHRRQDWNRQRKKIPAG